MMTELELRELESTVNEYIKSHEEKLQKDIEKTQLEIDDIENNINDKPQNKNILSNNRYHLNNAKNELRLVSELSKVYHELCFFEGKSYELPEGIQKGIYQICSKLPEEHISKIENIINNCMRPYNSDKKKKVEHFEKEIQTLLRKLHWENNRIIRNLNETDTLGHAIGTISHMKERQLSSKSLFIYEHRIDELREKDNSVLGQLSGQDRLLNKIEELIAVGKIKKDKNNESIIKNLSTIKEIYNRKKELEDLRDVLWEIIPDLQNEDKIDFTPLIKYLEKIKNNVKKEIKKCEAYLSKFNFSIIEQEVKQIEKEEKKENQEKDREQNYINLSYNLEKTLQETPNDLDRINEIKGQLRLAANGLDDIKIMELKKQGEEKYHREEQKRKEEVESSKAKIQARDDTYNYAMRNLRQAAIDELERNNSFDTYEYRNGDIRSSMTPEKREAMIQRKIEEMKRIANMTPEQRGLEDLKKSGVVPSSATLDSLPYQQRQDLNLGYRDETYGYVGLVRQSMKEISEVANTVYKDYILYLAGEKDKEHALKFSEFAKNKGYSMTEDMVDESVKGVSR